MASPHTATAAATGSHPQVLPLLDQGVAYARSGSSFHAEQCFREVTKLDPSNVDGWHLLAMLAGQEKQYDKAIELYKRALKLRPNFAEAHSNLGNLYKEAGRSEEAVESYRNAVRLQPENPVFHCNLGSGLHQIGAFDAAKKAFGKALHLDDTNADAWCNLAVIHTILGEKKEKAAACEKALEARPSYGQAYHILAQDKKWQEKGSRFEQMAAFLRDPALPVEDRVHMGYALGKISEDMGEYDAAFSYFSHANLLKRQGFTLDIHASRVQIGQIARRFGKEWIAENNRFGHKDSRPVFIVGLPRSGTTLVEQILDQHTDVHGGGERMFIGQIIRGLERDAHQRYPRFMDSIPQRVYGEAGAYYMKQLAALAPKARYITDKLPGNFAHVGFIKTVLPEAKIIWCRRDYRDNAVSLFKRQFGGYVPYAYDLYEIGHMSDMCERLRGQWREALGEEEMLEVVYEEVVADVEKQARRMVAFLGLEWQEACLNFHTSTRAVTTASYEQVRRPIYDSSVGVWKHYEKHLAPLEAGMKCYAEFPLL